MSLKDKLTEKYTAEEILRQAEEVSTMYDVLVCSCHSLKLNAVLVHVFFFYLLHYIVCLSLINVKLCGCSIRFTGLINQQRQDAK